MSVNSRSTLLEDDSSETNKVEKIKMKLRKKDRTPEEQKEFDDLVFVLPRKKCTQMIPELARICKILESKDGDADEHSTQKDAFSDIMDFISASGTVKTKRQLVTEANHRLHVLKKIMRTARVKNIDLLMEHYLTLDKSDRVRK